MKSKVFLQLEILLVFMIASCGTSLTPTQGGNNQKTSIEVQITGSESKELGTEIIRQQNCTGNAEVENTVERSRAVEHIIELQNEASVNANGQVSLFGKKVDLGATVASQFGQSYGTSETLIRSITVKAKAGTSMEHVIRQLEIWKVGQAEISVGGQQTIIPFKFRSDFAIELVRSNEILCPPTIISPSNTELPPTPFLTSPTPVLSVLNIRKSCGSAYTVETGNIVELHYGGWYAQGLDVAIDNANHLTVTLSVDGQKIPGIQQPVRPVTSASYPGADCTPTRNYSDAFGFFYIANIGPLTPGEHSVQVVYSFDKQITDGGYDNNGNPDYYGPGELDPQQFTIIARP
jgi:hypothetical protein